MRCTACAFENASGIKFCGECGLPLKAKCPSCGFANASGIKFCGECGKPLSEPSKSAPSPDPRAYTPKHLVEKILMSRSAVEGERKQVTVLFADVKGSMDLAEQVDPEEWHKILDRFFAILTEGFIASRGPSISTWATASWRCSAPVADAAGVSSTRTVRDRPRWGARSSQSARSSEAR
jgi:hypothetical protein